MENNIFFHGTKKDVLYEVLNKGLKTRPERATFTQNPQYALNYSGKNPVKDGLLLVFKNKNIKRAKDSNLVLNKKDKIITGWPNRWRTEQYGYYLAKSQKEATMSNKSLICIFLYNREFLNTLNSLSNYIIQAKINRSELKKYEDKLERNISNRKIQVIKPRISLRKLSSIMVKGMIKNLLLREIRANYVSLLVLNRWRIHNPGQHSCERWLKKQKDAIKQMTVISKIIHEDFIPKEVKKEFILRYKNMNQLL